MEYTGLVKVIPEVIKQFSHKTISLKQRYEIFQI